MGAWILLSPQFGTGGSVDCHLSLGLPGVILAEFSLFWGVLWVGLDSNGLALVAFCSQWCCNYLGRAVLV